MATRVSKEITDQKDLKEILDIKESDITSSLIMELFGEFNKKQRFHPYDTIVVPVGAYGNENKRNSNRFKTTIGIWIFNRYFIEKDFTDILGYINYEIDGKQWEKIMDKISRARLEGDISLESLDRILEKTQFMMPMCTPLTPAISEKMLNVSAYIEPKKKELIKKYKKELDAGNIEVASKMEKELIDYAMDYLKDDPALDVYLSGARSNIGNNFKNMYIMKGAIKNPDPNAEKEYDIALSNYDNGISKDEYALFCKSLATGPFSRAKKTEVGGWWEKLFVMAYQHIRIGKPGSDCGTTDTISVELTEKNVDDWMYSYIKSGSNLIELTSKNMDKYIGKTVEFRYSSLCESKDCICNMCAGNLTNRLGSVKNIGVAESMIGSIKKNKDMKAFHDATVATSRLDPKKAFGV